MEKNKKNMEKIKKTNFHNLSLKNLFSPILKLNLAIALLIILSVAASTASTQWSVPTAINEGTDMIIKGTTGNFVDHLEKKYSYYNNELVEYKGELSYHLDDGIKFQYLGKDIEIEPTLEINEIEYRASAFPHNIDWQKEVKEEYKKYIFDFGFTMPDVNQETLDTIRDTLTIRFRISSDDKITIDNPDLHIGINRLSFEDALKDCQYKNVNYCIEDKCTYEELNFKVIETVNETTNETIFELIPFYVEKNYTKTIKNCYSVNMDKIDDYKVIVSLTKNWSWFNEGDYVSVDPYFTDDTLTNWTAGTHSNTTDSYSIGNLTLSYNNSDQVITFAGADLSLGRSFGSLPSAGSNITSLHDNRLCDGGIDTNDYDCWYTQTTSNAIAGFNFTQPRNIVELRYIGTSDEWGDGTRNPKNFVVQASNDDTNWVGLYKFVGVNTIAEGFWQNYTFNNNTGWYKYYRMFIEDNHGGNRIVICEQEWIEHHAAIGTFTSQVFDAGSSVQWDNITIGNNTAGETIKFQVRTCGDDACASGTFVGRNNLTTEYFYGNETGNYEKGYAFNFSGVLPDEQYFQYKAYFETTKPNETTPYLEWVNITYSGVSVGPSVTTSLTSPADQTTDDDGSITFTCSATATNSVLVNMTLYYNVSGTFAPYQTKSLSGVQDSETFGVTLGDGTNILWNCLAYNNATNSSWATNNWSVGIRLPPPEGDATLLSLQGKVTNSTGGLTDDADLTAVVVNTNDCNAGGNNLIYNHTFTNEIQDGIFSVLLGNIDNLILEYNKDYYMCTYVNSELVGDPQKFRGGQGEIGGEDIEDNVNLNNVTLGTTTAPTKLQFFSPDGSPTCCGPDDSDVWSCTSGYC